MKPMTKTRLPVLLSALLLCGTGAFAQPNPPPGQKLVATVDATATARAIQSATFDDRETVLTGLEARLTAVHEILAGCTLSDSNKDDVKKATEAVRNHIRASRDSTAADWPHVRSRLDEAYSDYVATVLRVQEEAAAAANK